MGVKTIWQKLDKENGFKIFSMIFIITSAVFLFWRAKFGFGFNDEAFVVTLGERLFDGDALFYDEWHLSQNFGVVMLPFFAFTKLFGVANDGIILMLRYCYCVLWLGTCLSVYFTLNKKYKSSILVYAYLIFFAPFDIQSITYNSIGLMAVLLLCCIFYKINAEEKCPLRYKICFSLLWIVLTLCSPLMGFAYVLSFIAVLIISKYRKGYFKQVCSCYLFSGIIVAVSVVIYFFVFIYSRADMSHITEGVGYMLSDPEHQGSISAVNFFREIYYMLHHNHLFVLSAAVACVIGLLKNADRSCVCRYLQYVRLFTLYFSLHILSLNELIRICVCLIIICSIFLFWALRHLCFLRISLGNCSAYFTEWVFYMPLQEI